MITINFIKAEIFNLSSIKPKVKIEIDVMKNKIKFLSFLKKISFNNKFGFLRINKK